MTLKESIVTKIEDKILSELDVRIRNVQNTFGAQEIKEGISSLQKIFLNL